ncbi:hypothetical protein [Pandoraea pnomenusa]|uniref:hypothetical protein n=1 Tax=Pandoraea pnomenusa TaxID=93220 RepID=UPI0012DA6E7B|nr:hypothetical protein [Pandoraea pnomenusa]
MQYPVKIHTQQIRERKKAYGMPHFLAKCEYDAFTTVLERGVVAQIRPVHGELTFTRNGLSRYAPEQVL